MASRGSAKVTIGMPVFNGERFVGEALRSICGQSFQDFEVIISDNSSTDRTLSICQDFAKSDRRIRIVRQPTNLGAIENFNFVLRQATGQYFKWAAADDVFDREYLDQCVAVLDSDTNCAWCHCDSDMIDEQGESWLNQLTSGDPLVEVDANGSLAWKGHPRQGAGSDSPAKRFGSVLLGTTWTVDSYGLIRRESLMNTRLLVPLYGAEKVLMAELSLYGTYRHIPKLMFRQRIHQLASSNLTSGRKQNLFASQSKRPRFAATRFRLMTSHLKSVLRSPLSVNQKLSAIGYLIRYVFQFRKWSSVLRSFLSGQGVGGDGNRMMNRAAQSNKNHSTT